MATSKKPQPAAKKVDKLKEARKDIKRAEKALEKAVAANSEAKPGRKVVKVGDVTITAKDDAGIEKALDVATDVLLEKHEVKKPPVRRGKLQPPVLKGVDESKIKPVSAKPVTPPKARAVQRVESLLDKALGGQDATPVTEAPPRPTYEPPVQQAQPPAWEAEQASTVMPRAESTAPKPKKTRAAPEGKLSFDEMMEARRVATTPAAQTGGVDFTQYFKR